MKILIVLLMIINSLLTVAHATVITGKITDVQIFSNYGGIAQFKMDNNNYDSSLACHTNGTWDFQFEPETDLGKAFLSTVLTAYSTQAEVYITGTNTCHPDTNTQNLRSIRLKP